MRGLDTNVLVRYLTQDDPAQAAKATVLIEDAARRGDRLHIDDVVLCELVWVLKGAYGFKKQPIVDALTALVDAAQFHVLDRDLLREAVHAFREGKGDLADYVLGLRNRKAGCNGTATFDRALAPSPLFTQL